MARAAHRWSVLLVAAAAAGCAGGSGAASAPPSAATPPSAGQPQTQPASRAAAPAPHAPRPFPGFLMIADRGNDRALLVDGRKRVLWRYPRPGRRPAMPFRYDDDVFFTPGFRSIISNQEDQETVQVIGFPGGHLLWRYGHVNRAGSAPGYLDNPDDAYMLPDGRITVADPRNCRVLVLAPPPAHRVMRRYGRPGACAHAPPRLLASPNGDTPLPGGGMLVSEIGGAWIDDLSPNGRLRWAVHAPVAYPSDAQMLPSGRILVADYSNPGHVVIMTRRGRVVWRYGPPGGRGRLDHPSLALMLPGGLIAVNDDYRDRVVLIDRRTRRIVWTYGHVDRPGRAQGYLDTPDGMDFLPVGVALSDPAIRRLVRGSLVSSRPAAG